MNVAIVSGALANKPFNGGNAWSRLSWVLGFKEMGFDVVFVEQIDSRDCVDHAGQSCAFEQSCNLSYFVSVMERFGLREHAALLCDEGQGSWGLPMDGLKGLAKGAALLFNMSGHLTIPGLKALPRCRVFYDDDPGYTQLWQAQGVDRARLEGHDFFYTIGENIGTADCPVPVSGIPWRHTRTPAVMSRWPVVRQARFERFTTVASWRGAYGPVEFDGKTYGVKAHQFRKFATLPRVAGRSFGMALQIHPADRKDLEMLVEQGWLLSEPVSVAGDPEAFQTYIQGSSAEFSVAQGMYVDTNCGWFSDRSVKYLASGKPVLVQETGFSRNIRAGRGLVSFRNLDEAIAGVDSIVNHYESHCQAARQVAEEFFDSAKVIHRLLDESGILL